MGICNTIISLCFSTCFVWIPLNYQFLIKQLFYYGDCYIRVYWGNMCNVAMCFQAIITPKGDPGRDKTFYLQLLLPWVENEESYINDCYAFLVKIFNDCVQNHLRCHICMYLMISTPYLCPHLSTTYTVALAP